MNDWMLEKVASNEHLLNLLVSLDPLVLKQQLLTSIDSKGLTYNQRDFINDVANRTAQKEHCINMSVVLSDKMKAIMADPASWKQFSDAMDMTAEQRRQTNPTVSVNGKTYFVKTGTDVLSHLQGDSIKPSITDAYADLYNKFKKHHDPAELTKPQLEFLYINDPGLINSKYQDEEFVLNRLQSLVNIVKDHMGAYL